MQGTVGSHACNSRRRREAERKGDVEGIDVARGREREKGRERKIYIYIKRTERGEKVRETRGLQNHEGGRRTFE